VNKVVVIPEVKHVVLAEHTNKIVISRETQDDRDGSLTDTGEELSIESVGIEG
jgi:hypothetical protein